MYMKELGCTGQQPPVAVGLYIEPRRELQFVHNFTGLGCKLKSLTRKRFIFPGVRQGLLARQPNEDLHGKECEGFLE